MDMSDLKNQVISAVKKLPESATFEDILDIIYVQRKIAIALKQSEYNNVISHAEMLIKIKNFRESQGMKNE